MRSNIEVRTKEFVSFRRTLNQIGAALLLFLVLRMVLFSLLLNLAELNGLPVTATGEPEKNLVWWGIYSSSNLLSLGLPALILYRLQYGQIKLSAMAKPPQGKQMLAAVPVLFFLSILLSYGFNWLMEQLSHSGWYIPRDTIAAPTGAAEQVIYFILLAVLVPLLEEWLFRGVILHSLLPHTRYAIVTSAVCFGLAHGDLIYNLYAFFMGIAFAYFVWRTHSVWTGVAAHMLVNGIGAIGQLLQVSASGETVTLFNTIIYVLAALLFIPAATYWFRHRKQEPLPQSEWKGKTYAWAYCGAGICLCAAVGLLFLTFSGSIGG